MNELRIRPLRVKDEAEVLAAQKVMAADNFEFALDLADAEHFGDYVQRLANARRGMGLPGDRVPAAMLVADVDGAIVGRTSIRFELNDWLRTDGGHIGYGVLPAYRRRGYATSILRQSLIVARSHGVGRVLLTCDDANVGSARVIEACGGVLDPEYPLTRGAVPTRRYWID